MRRFAPSRFAPARFAPARFAGDGPDWLVVGKDGSVWFYRVPNVAPPDATGEDGNLIFN